MLGLAGLGLAGLAGLWVMHKASGQACDTDMKGDFVGLWEVTLL